MEDTMERRKFIAAIAASLSSGGSFLHSPDKIADRLCSFRSEIQSIQQDDAFWKRVQAEFGFDKKIVYLNCGTIGVCPRIVTDALISYTRESEQNPLRNQFGEGLAKQLSSVRKLAADFLGANIDEVAITNNTTQGMNAIANGLGLKRGDEVLTTNHEHPGGMVCWQHLAKHVGLKVKCIKLPARTKDKDEILNLVSDGISARTRVCSFSHIDTITGMVLPIAEISKIARQKEIFFVCDGAQAPGMLQVDVKKLGVDAYASSSHKWMLAPKGSGLLYVNKEVPARVHPMQFYSGFRVYSASSGTCDVARVLAHGIAMRFLNTIGSNRIETRIRDLNDRLKTGLLEIASLNRLTPVQSGLSSGIVTFAIDRSLAKSGDICDTLENEWNTYVKTAQTTFASVTDSNRLSEDYNAIRFSTHIFNDENEIDNTVSQLKKILR